MYAMKTFTFICENMHIFRFRMSIFVWQINCILDSANGCRMQQSYSIRGNLSMNLMKRHMQY